MPENESTKAQWTGLDLFDLEGDKIGKVDEVRSDAMGALDWLVVETGFLGLKKVLIPANDVRQAGDKLSVSYTKERVKDAPQVEDEDAPSEAEKGKLCRYYGLQYGGAAGDAAEGCETMNPEDIRAAG